MPQISLPKTFFTKERDNLYSDWRTAFFREMFQNSIDASSTRINVSFIEDEHTGLIVEFSDDGLGMTRETIERVFFALGETTKTGSSTGGFGRARILTCFAMDSYEFWTHNLYVKGNGANYEIEETETFKRGCSFRIVIGKSNDKNNLKYSLRNVLEKSQINCKVFVEGVQWTNWLYKRRLIKTGSFGDIHVNKSGEHTNSVIVRVNGLWMYSIYCEAKAQVIVEIDPLRSRDILTVNRDGMHYIYNNDLQSFINELSVDTRSALKSNRRKTRLIEGTGVHVAHKEKNEKIVQNNDSEKDTADTVISGTIAGSIAASKTVSIHAQEFSFENIPGEQIQTGLPSIYINDETDYMNPSHEKVRKIINNFDPTKWVHSIKKVRGESQEYRKGSNYLKLLVVWEACCLVAIRSLLKTSYAPSSMQWLVGWTFSFDDNACHIKLPEGHALCLNPVTSNGNLRYKTRDRTDQIRLMALAKHEVAHTVVSFHNEDYASVLTAIDSHFDASECFRSIRNALSL